MVSSEITNEKIEKELGYEITDYHIRPVYDNNEKHVGYSVRVIPQKTLEYININYTPKLEIEL